MLPRPSRRALAAWDDFRKEFRGGNAGDTDYIDPLDSDEWARGLDFAIRSSKPHAIYYFAKPGVAFAFATGWADALPVDATLITRPMVAPAHYAAAVRREADRCHCRIRFVGDLDPQDLAIYLSLAFGDYSMRPRAKSAVPIAHTGINDAWLAAAEKAPPPGGWRGKATFLEATSVPMGSDERRYLEIVEQLGPPLEQWVGPRCANLLRNGRKIEVEACLNLPKHSAPYTRALQRLLGR